MTHLRDARLQRALDNAPDANERPAEVTRIAIQNIARKSMQKSGKAQIRHQTPWWQRGWDALGHPPWNAAFATLLLGGIIGLLWHGQEVPDAAPDRPTLPPPTSSTASSPASAPAALPTPTDAKTLEETPPLAAARSKAKTTEQRRPADKSNAPMANPLPASDVADALPAMAPPANLRMPAAAPAAAMRAAPQEKAELQWVSATLRLNDKTVVVNGAPLRTLTQTVNRLVMRSTQTTDLVPPYAAPLQLRLTDVAGDQSVLDLWPQVLLWQAAGQAPQIRLADDATAQALRAEAARLLGP